MALGDRVRARPGWLLDETASAGRENLDADHVGRYDQKEDAAAEEEVALLKSLGLDHRSTVVDLGAGTGQFATAVSGSCRRVVAVDVPPEMLRTFRANVAAAAVDNIEVVQAGFLTYEQVGAPADFVYSRFALHHRSRLLEGPCPGSDAPDAAPYRATASLGRRLRLRARRGRRAHRGVVRYRRP